MLSLCNMTGMNLSVRFSLGLAAVVFAAGCAAESGDAETGATAATLEVASPRTMEIASPYAGRAGQAIGWTADTNGVDVLQNRPGAVTAGAAGTLDALDTRGDGTPRLGEDPTLDVLREPQRVSGRAGDFAQASKTVPR